MENPNMCSHPECSKPASMQCPNCIKLGLEPSYFCSQECFKDMWPVHKLSHVKKDTTKETHFGFKFTGPLRPFPYSFQGRREVPTEIPKPDYVKNSMGAPNADFQRLKDKVPPIYEGEQLQKVRAACRIGREALDAGHAIIKPGVTTEEIDKVVHEYIIS